MRPSGRANDALRPVVLEPGYAKHAEGSCLVRIGDTVVLCTASVDEKVPPFLRNSGSGWVTAEYGMLPRSTHTRTDREAAGEVHDRPVAAPQQAVGAEDLEQARDVGKHVVRPPIRRGA